MDEGSGKWDLTFQGRDDQSDSCSNPQTPVSAHVSGHDVAGGRLQLPQIASDWHTIAVEPKVVEPAFVKVAAVRPVWRFETS